MGKYSKRKKNMKSSSIKARTPKFKRETAIKTEFELSRKKEHSLIADTKLKIDQINRKMEAKFNKQILKARTTISFQAIN